MSIARPARVGSGRRGIDSRWWACAAAIVVFAVFIWGGYVMRWRWTGLSRRVTLWDWLQVVALPIAVGASPLLLTHRRRLTERLRAALAGVVLVFAALVLAGYVVPLSWTGFTGNTLWNWLELVLLPLVVSIASLWPEHGLPNRRHLVLGAVVGVVLAGLAILGYLVPLRWTGFPGNTAWDWLKLLLLPIVVPTLLLPLVRDRLSRRLERDADDATSDRYNR